MTWIFANIWGKGQLYWQHSSKKPWFPMGLSGCWAGHGFTIIEFHLWWWGMINTILDFEEESFSPLEWKKPP